MLDYPHSGTAADPGAYGDKRELRVPAAHVAPPAGQQPRYDGYYGYTRLIPGNVLTLFCNSAAPRSQNAATRSPHLPTTGSLDRRIYLNMPGWTATPPQPTLGGSVIGWTWYL